MSILQEAHDLIYGDRAEAYGDAHDGFEKIARMWGAYIYQKYGFSFGLDPQDVCWMMALLKMCRQMNAHSDDNLVDAAGYIGLVEKVRSGQG